MLISYNWLKEYLNLEISPQKLSEELTLMGLEVTEIVSVNPPIPGLAVGEVMEKWKHPNADRLNLTQIRHLQDGKEIIDQVVCGAANIAAGQKIILARVGTELSPGFVIKKAKIRGEESCGMVCSLAELGKEKDSEGIWVLPPDTALDTPTQEIMGKTDYLLNFDITSNRWDCMSVFGIVRETAVLLGDVYTYVNRGSFAVNEKLKIPDISSLSANSRIRVEIEDPSDCYRYQGLDITNITVTDSPGWLAERLFQHGLRSIENVVDVTNLILREYGQPIHAFDADKIGKVITIRKARSGETLTILDGKKINLHPDDLVIADENVPIALAGVMGGIDTGVTAKTKNVFLETAVFDSKRIRQTMARHQLSTDAGRYFQHKVDPVFSQEVVKIAGAAIAHLGKGEIPHRVIDVFPAREKSLPKKITLTRNLLDKTLGHSLPSKEVVDVFTRLHFTPIQTVAGDDFSVTIPSHRLDVEEEWDLIEEVARVYGYDKFPQTYPRITNGFGILTKEPERERDSLREQTRYLCLSMGFNEVLTYPFIENRFAECLGIHEENYLKPINPVWNDISLLRNSLLFGFLKTIQLNTEKKVAGFNRIFEINKVFSPLSESSDPHSDASPYEHRRLGLAVWSGEQPAHWQYPQTEPDYAELSGAVETIFREIFGNDRELYFSGMGNNQFAKNMENVFRPGSEVSIVWRGKTIGVIGEITEKVKDYFDLESATVKKKVFYAELDIDTVFADLPAIVRFNPFSVYPAIRRDLALVLDLDDSVQNILKELPTHSPLLSQVTLTDVYQGENIPAGKKSVVFALEFISPDKTLQRGEADREVLKIVEKLQKKHNFTLR